MYEGGWAIVSEGYQGGVGIVPEYTAYIVQLHTRTPQFQSLSRSIVARGTASRAIRELEDSFRAKTVITIARYGPRWQIIVLKHEKAFIRSEFIRSMVAEGE